MTNNKLWPRIWRHIQGDVYAVATTVGMFLVGTGLCLLTGWRLDLFMIGWVAFIAVKTTIRVDRRHL